MRCSESRTRELLQWPLGLLWLVATGGAHAADTAAIPTLAFEALSEWRDDGQQSFSLPTDVVAGVNGKLYDPVMLRVGDRIAERLLFCPEPV